MVQATLAQANRQRRDSASIVETITQTLSILAEPGQVVELRIPGLKGNHTDSGYFTDMTRLAQAALTYNGRAEGIYVTLNPLNPALLARSSNRIAEYAKNTSGDKDVVRRRWLFVDFDPVRPAGISSSDIEHSASLDRAVQCRSWLQEQQIHSVLADSGNGAHLLIPIDLPNTESSTMLLKNILAVLHENFSDEQVEVDTSTVNASRIIKLYGTLACKGDDVPDRPHRQAILLDVPETCLPVDNYVLEAFAALSSTMPVTQKVNASDSSTRTDASTNGFDHSLIDEIKAQFDMVAYAEKQLGVTATQQGHEYRLTGNHGLLINPEKRVWFHWGGQLGGDALDLVGYLKHGSAWNRRDKSLFKLVLCEAADFAGIVLSRSNQALSRGKDESSKPSNVSQPESSAIHQVSLDLMDIAQAWKLRYAEQWAWDIKVSSWRHWSGTHWMIEREPETLDLLAVEVMRSLGIPVSSGNKIDSVIRLARALSKREFKPSHRLINFQNGTLDLDTMTGHVHTPSDNLTSCLPYDYQRTGEYPTIKHLLSSSMPDKEAQRAYMAHVGLALMGDNSFHKSLVLIGPTRSGKTTLLKLAQFTLGSQPGNFATETLFSGESRGANSRATWLDQSPRLVCLDEFPEEAVRDEGEEIFKSMSAHGGVAMWLKYHDERAENIWTPKLMFATNNRMRYRDPSGALTRRLLVAECPNSLPDLRLDHNLLKKCEPELGGFAAACIAVALETLESHIYPESTAMRALLIDIEQNGDAVKLWLAENCVFETSAFTPTQALYSDFRLWCEENGLHAVSRPKLRDMICGQRSGIRSTKQRTVDPISGVNKPLWGMVGVRLRTAKDDLGEEASSVIESST